MARRQNKDGNRDASGEVDRYRSRSPSRRAAGKRPTREQPRLDDALARRINTDPDNLERGLAQLVLTIVQLLRPAHGAPRHARSPNLLFGRPG
jgi:hypothetical protein